jgi:acyl carrier protein
MSTRAADQTQTEPATDALNGEIRRIIGEHARLAVDASTLAADADLYSAGMHSHASVRVMLALEDRFDIEFPDHMLTSSVFANIASIETAVAALRAGSQMP